MTKTQRRIRHIQRRHIGGFTTKNLTGNSNSKGLGVKTFRFHPKHIKKIWNRKKQ